MNIFKLAISGSLVTTMLGAVYAEQDVTIRPWINYYHKIDRIDLIKETVAGSYFEPRAFWSKDIKDQMMFLKEEIQECDLIKVIAESYRDPYVRYFHAPCKPYPHEVEERFEQLVYEKIKPFDEGMSFEDFKASLNKVGAPAPVGQPEGIYASFLEAPLLYHFEDYLCPRSAEGLEDQDEPQRILSIFETWLEEEKDSQ